MQGRNSSLKQPVAALPHYRLCRVTQARWREFSPVSDQKLSETFITRLKEDREIAAIDHVPRRMQRLYPFNEIAEVRNHFWRTAGKIDSWNLGLGQPIDNAINRCTGHNFFPLRSRVYVAMHASEIAKLANVDLKNLGASTTKGD